MRIELHPGAETGLFEAAAWYDDQVLGLGNDLLVELGQWLDLLPAAVAYVLKIWSDVRQWNIVLPAMLLGAVWLFFRGRRQDRINLILPAAFLAGLLAVVLSHGPDWSWQLGAVWNRLTIQGLAVLIPVVACGFGHRRTKPEALAP